MVRILLISLLLAAGCASQSTTTMPVSPALSESYSRLSSTYPALTSKIREFLKIEADKAGIGDDASVVTCSLTSFLKGIPDSDLTLMEAAIETRQLTSEREEAFVKWMGPGYNHGAKNGANYKDGTPRDYVAENAVTRRAQGNARDLCPDLLDRYPVAFHY